MARGILLNQCMLAALRPFGLRAHVLGLSPLVRLVILVGGKYPCQGMVISSMK